MKTWVIDHAVRHRCSQGRIEDLHSCLAVRLKSGTRRQRMGCACVEVFPRGGTSQAG